MAGVAKKSAAPVKTAKLLQSRVVNRRYHSISSAQHCFVELYLCSREVIQVTCIIELTSSLLKQSSTVEGAWYYNNDHYYKIESVSARTDCNDRLRVKTVAIQDRKIKKVGIANNA
jgi:hypothetical protein